MSRRACGAVTLLAILARAAWADDSALGLADLGRYRAALIRHDREPAPLPASFRQVWDHPERYQDRRVEVEGRVVRRFRQGAFGTFPPLVEAWAVTPKGEPFCWVFPDTPDATPLPRETVRFAGTYIKRIRYEGADVPRLAPLIVGPRAPVAATIPSATRRSLPGWPGSRVDCIVGLVAALVVLAILTAQHLRRPTARRPVLERAPDFVDGQSISHDDADRPRDIA